MVMIRFVCKLCGEVISVQDQLSGRQMECPKCKSIRAIPDKSPKIKFHCKSCGQRIRVAQIHAGKKGKCPKCKKLIVIPTLQEGSAEGSGMVTLVCSICNETIHVPEGSKKEFIECPGCSSYMEAPSGSVTAESAASGTSIPSGADEDPYEDESDLPEEGASMDRRLIFIISGVAAVVVVGLIILVTVILPSRPRPAEKPEDLRSQQQVAYRDLRPKPVTSDRDLQSRPVTFDKSDAARSLDLKLRLKPRQKYRLRIINEDKVSMTMMEQRQDINSISTVGLEFEVEQIDANSIAWIKVTYLTLREKAGSAAGQMEYDSTKPDAATDHAFAQTYSAMIGQSFVMKVTPEGKMLELQGIDEMYMGMAEKIVEGEDESIRKRAMERMADGAEERAERTIENLNQRYGSRKKREEAVSDLIKKNPLFTEEKIRGTVGNVIMPFPGGFVEIGDSWQGKAVLPAGAPIDIDLTYTLKQKKQGMAVVGISSKIELIDEPASTKDSPLGATKANVTGSYEGSVQIDSGSGWTVRKNTTMRCSGEMKMAPNEQMPQEMSLPITMESITTVEPIE